MLKFLVYGILVMQGVCTISAKLEVREADTKIPTLDLIAAQKSNESNERLGTKLNRSTPNLRDSFRADRIVCNVIGQGGSSQVISTCVYPNVWWLANDGVTANGKSVLKLHLRKVPWNRARRICVEEGGNLAIPQTDSEENEIREMMLVDSVDDVWLGFHDQFEEGDWITVLDQPFVKIGRTLWAKLLRTIPNNGKKHCGRLVSNDINIDNDMCELRKSFVCKIPTL